MRTSLLTFLTLLLTLQLSGQVSFELGMFLGASNYAGDLVTSYAPRFNENGPAFGILGRSSLSSKFSIRGNLLYGTLSGDDRNYDNRNGRAFQFKSTLWEASVVAEWEPFGKRRYYSDARGNLGITNIISPYLFSGVGMGLVKYETDFSRTVREDLAAKIVEDQKQGDTDAFIAIPFGLGVKFDMSNRFVISAEFGMHFPFTDRLDGISASGDSTDPDWFYSGGLIFSYRFFSGGGW